MLIVNNVTFFPLKFYSSILIFFKELKKQKIRLYRYE